MCTVIDFNTRAVRNRPSIDEVLADDVAIARSQTAASLARQHPAQRVAEAQARAERLVRSGISVSTAVRRACAWANAATDPFPPPSAA